MSNDKKPNNPPAFPCPSLQQDGFQSSENDFNYVERGAEGMTLRDYFAAKAMQAIMADIPFFKEILKQHSDLKASEAISIEAYAIADAMLKEREK